MSRRSLSWAARIGVACFAPVLLCATDARAQWPTNPDVNLAVSLNVSQFPVAVSDGAGGAIIAWENESGLSVPGDIYAQRVSATGAVLWAPANGVALTLDLDDQLQPRMVSDGAGGAIIVWQDGRNAG